jgi:hypothetical protein
MYAAMPLSEHSFTASKAKVGRPWRRVGITVAILMAGATGWSQVPEFFGTYALVDGKLVAMTEGKGNFTPSSVDLVVYSYQNSSLAKESTLVLEGKELRFEVFDADVSTASSGVELYRLPYGRKIVSPPDQTVNLLNQVTGHGKLNSTSSPLDKYIVAKTDALKIELLQKPVPGQPQMVQLVPATDLVPGVYCLFVVKVKAGQTEIGGKLFQWKGSSDAPITPYCVDLIRGNVLDEHDARLLHPFYLASDGYAACSGGGAPSAISGGAGPSGGGASTVTASCTDYNSCMQAGKNAFQASDWSTANASFQAAAKSGPQNGEPWVWLGRILLADRQSHSMDELSADWDNALSRRGDITIGACPEVAFRPCERGDLKLSVKSVTFLAGGARPVFDGAPTDITPGHVLNNPAAMHVSYSLKVGGKNYAIDFIPMNGATCQFNMMVQCERDGIIEQQVLAQYVALTLPKLVSGALVVSGPGGNPEPSTTK